MPNPNGVGQVAPAFGAGGYPGAGQWAGLWLPSYGINPPTNGQAFVNWRAKEGGYLLVGGGAPVVTTLGHSLAVQFPLNSGAGNSSGGLMAPFTGANVPWLAALKWHYDVSHPNSGFLQLSTGDGNQRVFEVLDNAGNLGVLRYDGTTLKLCNGPAVAAGNTYSRCFAFDGTTLYIISSAGIAAQLAASNFATALTPTNLYVAAFTAGTSNNAETAQIVGLLKPTQPTQVVNLGIAMCKWMESQP